MSSETPVPIDIAVSPARSEAARRNGSKSRGPKTEEGKHRASQNSLKHGMYSPKIVLPNEDQEEFDQLRHEYFTEFEPHGPAERHEVETMVVAEWRIRRFRRFETASLLDQMPEPGDDGPVDLDAAGAFLSDSETGLGGVVGYYKFEPACQRDYDRALRRLLDLKKRRNEPKQKEAKAAPKPNRQPAPAPQPVSNCAISRCPPPHSNVVEFHPMPPSHQQHGESSPTDPQTSPLTSSKQTPVSWPPGCTAKVGILINDQAKSYDRWK